MHPMSSGIRWWFESMDRTRRNRGAVMDRMGYGPVETPHEVVLSAQGMRLRRYSAKPRTGKAVLIVPAPIKRHYIWDLDPECSVVQRLLNEGFQVWLVEWLEPGEADHHFGLEHYALHMLDQCLDAIRNEGGPAALSLYSHSLGGVFATIYAALRPERVSGLVQVESPLHFARGSGSFGPLVAFGPQPEKVTQLFGCIPGSVLNLASMVASPATFGSERIADMFASMGSKKHMRSHLLVERWTLDEAPMSPALFEDVVDGLYRRDAFMQGALEIGGKRIGPQDVVSPLLAIYDPRSTIIPPSSIIAFHEAAASPVKRLIAYHGDTGVALAHVGALVGYNAHAEIWPEVIEWTGDIARDWH
ncbi:alpha/beta fold hydrolase [Noviherbaspirillum aerium]|uniref:alpha/beta fold hydrolase n=1 Tax=Noviherbaspirillum aerium TaxID=2588497 RepID=UPI00124C7679|nr:alpha/beta fold hydrolase [Noviherbaspirillum aerium]